MNDKKYIVLGKTKVEKDEEGKYHTYYEVLGEKETLKQAVATWLEQTVAGARIVKVIDWETKEK